MTISAVRIAQLHCACVQAGCLPAMVELHVWYQTWREHVSSVSLVFHVLQSLCAHGVQSETYQTARTEQLTDVIEWIERWVETGDWWPEESFNYGCV